MPLSFPTPWIRPVRSLLLALSLAAGHDCTIYHSGDNSNLEKMKPDRPVTIFIPHVEVGLPIEKSIRALAPQITFVSHVLELGHSPTPPQAWRWSFGHASAAAQGWSVRG